MTRSPAWDVYGVIPHHSLVKRDQQYEHGPCGMLLSDNDIQDNWCPYCVSILNRAAQKRGVADRRAS